MKRSCSQSVPTERRTHTFFRCWNRSRKEPSLENTLEAFALWWLGLEVETVDEPVDRAGEVCRVPDWGVDVCVVDIPS